MSCGYFLIKRSWRKFPTYVAAPLQICQYAFTLLENETLLSSFSMPFIKILAFTLVVLIREFWPEPCSRSQRSRVWLRVWILALKTSWWFDNLRRKGLKNCFNLGVDSVILRKNSASVRPVVKSCENIPWINILRLRFQIMCSEASFLCAD